MNRVGALTDLLLDLFDGPDELKAWVAGHATLSKIRHDVPWTGAFTSTCMAVVTKGEARGLWNADAFRSLQAHAPHKDWQIQAAARQWGVFAILPDPRLASGVEAFARAAPGHPGTPQNTRALAAAADVDLNGANHMPIDQILQAANAREPSAENVTKLASFLNKLADITQARPLESTHPIAKALDSLTSGQVDPQDAKVETVELVEVEEAVILDDIGFLPADFLSLGAAASRAVARLSVPRRFGTRDDGSFGHGTGFLLTDRLLMTNHHVVNMRHANEPDAVDADLAAQVTGMVVEFDLDRPDSRSLLAPVARLVAWSPRRTIDEPDGLDFAIVELVDPFDAQERPPPPLRSGSLPDSLAVNVIQHPRAGSKCVALRANQLKEQSADSIRYTSNTDEGSSGSPLLDDRWAVVGLHRSAVRRDSEIAGKKIQVLNVGTPIDPILASLRDGTAQGPDVSGAWDAISTWHGLNP